ncbi:MAG: septation protein A [Gammaproteobacteria bacterium RIFOXYA12_FULL_61_12]|nr:MAG: septation protein A [Gammaproteobacteria bacterium RIFOXYA12_FULL_61_12]OGT89644.1 MAG: septation protein A [Gammaproteobacteria bacterium RIFOXYD12_FULL_61_37]
MQLLAAFFPILLFFAFYKAYGIFAATAAAMVAALAQTLWHWVKHGKLEKMHLVTLVMLVVLGGLTLAFQDPTFIKWKPTLVNWLFGFAFLLSPLFGGKVLTERMMSHAVELPAPVWRQLNLAWALFFLSVGSINLYVAYNFDEETWVNFKLFGLLGLTFAFLIAQSFYMARHIKEVPSEEK